MTDPLRPSSSASDGPLPESVAAAPEPVAAPPPEAAGAPTPWAPDTSRLAPDPESAPEPPPLYDPYLVAPPPPRAGRSALAISAFVAAFLGPVGAILAIVFGHYARREIERSGQRRSGYVLATVGMVLGVFLTMGWGGALSYFAWTYHARFDPAGDEPGVAAPPDPAPTTPSAPHGAPPDLGPIAPRHTKVKREGAVTVVDVGVSSSSLSEELAKQRAEAAAAGETVMVMTTSGRCPPCRGVDQSLADPLLQTALAKVRLVRVDIQVFHEDLEQLKIPDEAIPGFFLLSLDLTPRDGVDGGEWDDDIPPNIGPVLGAFVRGKYAQRRRPWQPVPSSGMTL